MFWKFALRFGYTCSTVSKPLRGSGCRMALVTSARLLMSLLSTEPLSSINFRAVVNRVLMS